MNQRVRVILINFFGHGIKCFMICERKVFKIIIKKPNHFYYLLPSLYFYDINIMSKFDYEITLTMCLQILNIDGFHFSIIYPAE